MRWAGTYTHFIPYLFIYLLILCADRVFFPFHFSWFWCRASIFSTIVSRFPYKTTPKSQSWKQDFMPARHRKFVLVDIHFITKYDVVAVVTVAVRRCSCCRSVAFVQFFRFFSVFSLHFFNKIQSKSIVDCSQEHFSGHNNRTTLAVVCIVEISINKICTDDFEGDYTLPCTYCHM